eukprot:Skav234767  [mRNA]  locus=scaffold2396:68815:72187:- [translate_table: standard]
MEPALSREKLVVLLSETFILDMDLNHWDEAHPLASTEGAFASHVLTKESPKSQQEALPRVHGWYKEIVAKMIVRMQRNVCLECRQMVQVAGFTMARAAMGYE